MKKKLLLASIMIGMTTLGFSQNKNFWTRSSEPASEDQLAQGRSKPTTYKVFNLDFAGLQREVSKAPVRGVSSINTELIIDFPDPDGTIGRFRVIEASVLHPDLAARYPGIKSYAGHGIDDPTATIRFSIS